VTTADVEASADPFGTIVGQPRATEQLRAAVTEPVHAYLFVGPRGSGKRRAAAIVAGELVGDPSERARNRSLAFREEHPDLVIFEPEGPTFRTEEADAVVIAASRASTEAGRKVILIDRFHDATPEAAAKLLKPIEEPHGSVVFILLSEDVPPEHVTIASRSTRINFLAVSHTAIAEALMALGVAPDVAEAAGRGSGGDVRRAELLVSDPAFAARSALWWDAPARLDGSGHMVSQIVADIREAVYSAQEPLDARHAIEVETMDETEELTGTRGSGRRAMEARHKREARLHRTDEWRMGLATLARRYREGIADSPNDLAVFAQLRDAAEALTRNPNEELWLSGLLLALPPCR
jgi:DNA polymerase-3 subunit delta'